MRPGEESLFYAGAGPLAALLLGVALIPFRGLTPASNLAFAFLILTLVVAELGGRGASIATALTSALSLDFFLTQPYGRLSMSDKHDVIAFVALAVSGLVVASLGAARRERIRRLAAARRHRDLLRGLLEGWNPVSPPGPGGESALRACLDLFPLSAIVLRDAGGTAVWASGSAAGLRTVPEARLELPTLGPAGRPDASPGAPLPESGGRIPLVAPDGRRVGHLDVWGDGSPASPDTRTALGDVARLLGALLGGSPPETR